MKVYAGTSGFSYKEWKGPFYPDTLPATQMLTYYARRLPAVEINSSFYRMPGAGQLEKWSSQVPETFRFALKAPRRITHMKRLENCREETDHLFDVAGVLGVRLGCVLFQLPPRLRRDQARLEGFLDTLPRDVRVAMEFRHESWFDREVLDCLSARGLALVFSDSDDLPAPGVLNASDWAYLRLRRSSYGVAELKTWAKRLERARLDQAHVFFKHEDEGAAPRMAEDFLELAG